MNNFVNMLRDQSGASAAEYALILAVIGSVVAIAALTLGTKISTAMGDAGSCLTPATRDAAGYNAACN